MILVWGKEEVAKVCTAKVISLVVLYADKAYWCQKAYKQFKIKHTNLLFQKSNNHTCYSRSNQIQDVQLSREKVNN